MNDKETQRLVGFGSLQLTQRRLCYSHTRPSSSLHHSPNYTPTLITKHQPNMPLSENSNTPSLPAHRPSRQIKSKRNRRILACSFCREKKVKCDRVQPTCGRCLNGRHTCHYTSAPFRDENLTHQLFGIPFPSGFPNALPKRNLPLGFSLPIHESSMLYANEVSTPASDDHAAESEDPGASAESTSLRGQFGLSQHLRFPYRMDQSPILAVASHRHSEAVLYRSPTPTIRFHNSSAAISVLHSTPVILREACHILSFASRFTDPFSFLNWQISYRIQRYGAHSYHKPRLKL
jgi:hypothetical protein